jgi:hypothetical protein
MPAKFRFDMADVKPSVLSFITVGMMAAIFIVLLKFIFNKWRVPGFTQLANAI